MLKIQTKWETLKGILLSKRFKGFYWHGGAMIAAWVLGIGIELATEMQANDLVIVIMGLILAQITKFLNTNK